VSAQSITLNAGRSTAWRGIASEVAAAARELAARGWTPATAGNFSARIDASTIAVTISGRDKSRLGADDFLRVDLDGEIIDGTGRPSAEAELHLRLYRRRPSVGAVLHTHSRNQTIAGRVLARDGAIRFEGYELLKAFDGIDTHETRLMLPVFPNTQDMKRLAADVDARLADGGPTYGFLIDGHGLYAWGASTADAMRHLEAFDFLLGCELELERLSK
jgi:methylthioribulose-1-phosphate dehydratase